MTPRRPIDHKINSVIMTKEKIMIAMTMIIVIFMMKMTMISHNPSADNVGRYHFRLNSFQVIEEETV